MTKEALELALDALEVADSCVDGYHIPKGKTYLPEIEFAITAIKEALAQRTWAGLTDEEVKNLCLSVGTEPIEVRLIESKLKEKNT